MQPPESTSGSQPHSDRNGNKAEERRAPGMADKHIALSFDDGSLGAQAEALIDLFEDSTKNRYETLEKIGEGGMAAVYRAQDRRLGRIVALKRIRGDWHSSTRFLHGLVQQARAIASLNHFNIVQVYDIGRDEQGHFIAMEYVAGETLEAFVQREGPQPLAYVVELGRQLCNALEVAHRQGVIHGDIKPANVLLSTGGVPKLVDFGLALIGLDATPETAGTAPGRSHYAATEQVGDAKHVDARTDIYSAAATLYHVLTGDLPHQVREADLPAPIRPVLLKTLEEDPEHRYASASELGAALKNIALAVAESGPSPAAAPQLIACPKCGREIRSEVEFCGACGFEVRRAQATADLLHRAQQLLHANAPEQALRQYEAILEIDPEHSEARHAAESIRKALHQVAQLRKQANELTAVGALHKAISAWREVLTLVSADQEATTQIQKCQDQLRARQIVTLLTAARVDMRQHRFEAAEHKCRQVLESDPQNAEAIGLKWLIPQARQQWIQGLIKAAVEAYRAQDFNLAYNRFSEAYSAAERWLSAEELQKLTEGMEMARLVPAAHAVHNLAPARSLADSTAELNRLEERCTSPRAKQVIQRARAEIEERYWAHLAEEQRRAQKVAVAAQLARKRQRRKVALSCLAAAIVVAGSFLVVQQVRLRRLPAAAQEAYQNKDYATALRLLAKYIDRGGTRGPINTLQQGLTAELRRRLRNDHAQDARRWAAVLAPLTGKQRPEELLHDLASENYRGGLEQEHWRQVCIALEQMARYETAGAETGSQLGDHIERALTCLEDKSEPTGETSDWTSALQVFERTLDTGGPLGDHVTPDVRRRLWLLQLDAALWEGALERARDYADKLDRLDPNAPAGSERIHGYVGDLPQKAEAAALRGDFPGARRELRAGVQLRRAGMPEIRDKWEWLLDYALAQGRWSDARDVAEDLDQIYPAQPGWRRLESERGALLKKARHSIASGELADAQRLLIGVLELAGPADEVIAVLRRIINQVEEAQAWDDAYASVRALEDAGKGRGIGNAGYELLLDRAIEMRDAERAKRAVAELDQLLSSHGHDRLRHKLKYVVLENLRRALRSDAPDAQQDAMDALVALAPLFLWEETTWTDFCKNQDPLLTRALCDVYCTAKSENDHGRMQRIEQLNECLGLALDCDGSSH